MAVGSLALAALLLTLSAAADPPAPEQPRICRGGEARLGTRTRTPRRCLTAEQWQREQDERSQLPVSLQVTQGQNDGRVMPTPQ
jgi:hypothetical protein